MTSVRSFLYYPRRLLPTTGLYRNSCRRYFGSLACIKGINWTTDATGYKIQFNYMYIRWKMEILRILLSRDPRDPLMPRTPGWRRGCWHEHQSHGFMQEDTNMQGKKNCVKELWAAGGWTKNTANLNREWLCELRIWILARWNRVWVGWQHAKPLPGNKDILGKEFQEQWRGLPGAGMIRVKSFKQTYKIWWSHTEQPPPSPSLSNISWPNNGKAKPRSERST